MKIEVLYAAIVMAIVGIVLVIFKKQIGKIYDNMNMPEQDKERFKNIVLPLLGWALFVGGIILSIVYFVPVEQMKEIISKIEINKKIISLIAGIIVILYSIFTIIIRIAKKEEKLFSKIRAMKAKFGNVQGNIIHIVGYTVIPMAIGIYLILFI